MEDGRWLNSTGAQRARNGTDARSIGVAPGVAKTLSKRTTAAFDRLARIEGGLTQVCGCCGDKEW